jgi:uncharacterized membrane protein
MQLLMVVLRLIHVVGGVIWVGALVFIATLLGPSVRDAGPEGGKVMAQLQRRHLLEIIPAIAVLTIVSGVWLYWRFTSGFDPAISRSHAAMTYGVGGVLAIIALGMGLGILRPAMQRAGALAQQADPQQAAELQRLRQRGAKTGQVIAVLLVLAAACMAVARYI